MYLESGEMKVAKAKSVLKKVLQKEVSSTCIKKAIFTVVIDGSAISYLIPWPASCATVGNLLVRCRNYIEKQLKSYNVYLVFDRYREYSTKWGSVKSCSSAYHSYTHTTTKGYPNYSLHTPTYGGCTKIGVQFNCILLQ